MSASSSFAQNNIDDITIKEGVGTEKIILGNTKKEVIRNFGKSEPCVGFKGKILKENDVIVKDTRKQEKKKWKNYFCYNEHGLQILLKKNKVSSIHFTSTKYKTTKGISIGDSREKLLSIYGGTFDSPRVVYYPLGIAFVIDKNDNIIEIEVFNPQQK